MKVLICGAGIAGPALAYWLAHYGLEPTIVEKPPKLRTGGYIIDFWGLGVDIADRMGLFSEILRKGYMIQEVRIVDRTGKRIAGLRRRLLNTTVRAFCSEEAESSITLCRYVCTEVKVFDVLAQLGIPAKVIGIPG